MKEIRKTTQFKKDFKRIKNEKCKVEALFEIVGYLEKNQPIPKVYDPHPLTGNWKNYMECHIEDDFLLIWYDRVENKIELVRLGTHSELFCKGRKK